MSRARNSSRKIIIWCAVRWTRQCPLKSTLPVLMTVGASFFILFDFLKNKHIRLFRMMIIARGAPLQVGVTEKATGFFEIQLEFHCECSAVPPRNSPLLRTCIINRARAFLYKTIRFLFGDVYIRVRTKHQSRVRNLRNGELLRKVQSTKGRPTATSLYGCHHQKAQLLFRFLIF